MALKAEVVQAACPASGNMGVTGSTPSSDMLAAFFFGHCGTLNNDFNGSERFGFGCSDLTNNISIAYGVPTGGTSGAGGAVSNAKPSLAWTGTGSTATSATLNSVLSNGVRITPTSFASGRLLNALLLSGTGIQVKTGGGVSAVSDTSVVFNHGLGGTPDAIILLVNHGGTASETRGQAISIGFYDRRTGNMVSQNYRHETSMAPSKVTAIMDSTHIANYLSGDGTSGNTFTLTSIGSSQFTVAFNSALAVSTYIGFIAIRGTSNQLASSCGIFSTPTSTGVASCGMGVVGGRPQIVFMLPTYLTAIDTIKNDDTAGGMGMGIAATNDFSASTVGVTAFSSQDNVNPSNSNSFISNTKCLAAIDKASGTANILEAGMSAWNASDIALNYTTVDATSRKVMFLALGPITVNTTITPRTA